MNKIVYLQTLKSLRDALPEDRRENWDLQFEARKKSETVALVLSLLLGTFGIDRFYIGRVGLGILKLITFGGFGIWAIVDWFLIMGAARKKNLEIAQEIRNLIG